MATDCIKISECDNQIILIAMSRSGSSRGACQLLDYKSGSSKPANAVIYPATILQPGRYELLIIGINWGNTSSFKVTVVDTDNTSQDFEDSGKTDVGVVWQLTTPISV